MPEETAATNVQAAPRLKATLRDHAAEILAALGLAWCRATRMGEDVELIVSTPLGRLRGVTEEGVASFKGVPYAAPPCDKRRMRPAAPVESWDGVRDATRYGPTTAQWPYIEPLGQFLVEPIIPGDDCLNLNVWTPDPSSSGLPVMVWIPGGGFTWGTGATAVYNGKRFARDGVVCVTINYRLGAEGFLYTGDAVANLGLLDQVAALAWVQENIERFGGDPDRVTIAGESAGGISVAALLSMPRAKGLFRAAVAQSGAGQHALSPDNARGIAEELAGRLGVASSRDALAAVPAQQLLAAQMQILEEVAARPDVERWGDAARMGLPFAPVVDGDVLPELPLDGIAASTDKQVAVLVGGTAEEERLLFVPTGAVDLIDESVVAATIADYELPQGALETYRSARPGASPGDLLAAVRSDWSFRIPAIRLAEARARAGGAVWMYEFAWRSPAFGGRLGACHSVELPFVFDALDANPLVVGILGEDPPIALATETHDAWVRFVTDGHPGWPSYDLDRRTTMRFDDMSELVEDPRSTERRLWEGVR